MMPIDRGAMACPIIATTTFFSNSQKPSAAASRSSRGSRTSASDICASLREMRSCSFSARACSLRARFESCRACFEASCRMLRPKRPRDIASIS